MSHPTHPVTDTDDTVPQRAVRVGPQRSRAARAAVRLSEIVIWSVAPSNAVAGVVQWGTSLIRGRGVPQGELDPLVDPGHTDVDLVSLDVVQTRSLAPALGGGPRVILTLAGAHLVQGRRRRALALAELWLDAAAPLHGQVGPRKAAETVWEAVISGADSELVVRAPWLHLAALGTLAGWAEPA